MNELNNKLVKILKYWSHNIIFDSSELTNLDFSQKNNETVQLIEDIEFYVSEGLTEERSKKDAKLFALWTCLNNKNRSQSDYVKILESIVSYTSQVLDKENKIPSHIKNRYTELAKIPNNQRTNEEKIELSDLANQILQLSK